MPQKNIFRKSLNVLKVSFAFYPLSNCSSELLISIKALLVILACALCRQPNLLKANKKLSINLLVSLSHCLLVLPLHLIYLGMEQFQILKCCCCPVYRILLTLKFLPNFNCTSVLPQVFGTTV